MLRKCTRQEFERYAEAVYAIARDPARSGYPTYCDGIKTKEMFLERAERAFSEASEELLLFTYEGEVEGWIHCYCLPEDRYLSTEGFYVTRHTEQALREFLAYAQAHYRGFELYLGFPEDNRRAVDFLESNGFALLEKSCNHTAFLRAYVPVPVEDDIVRVTRENFAAFRALHDEYEMYWNADRLYADIEHWVIFARMQNGEALGSVYYTAAGEGWFEIFGVDRRDGAHAAETFRTLLGKVLNAAKEQGGRYMTFFCEPEDQATVQALGFARVGTYLCYRKRME